MDREAAVKMWREIGFGLPGGGATGRLIEAFAVAVEAAEIERWKAEIERLRAALLIGHTYAECCPTPASPDDRDQDCQACAALGPNVEANLTPTARGTT